jgi:hypothetical protein
MGVLGKNSRKRISLTIAFCGCRRASDSRNRPAVTQGRSYMRFSTLGVFRPQK